MKNIVIFSGAALLLLAAWGCPLLLGPPALPMDNLDIDCQVDAQGVTVTQQVDGATDTPEQVTVKGLKTKSLPPNQQVGTFSINNDRLGSNEFQFPIVSGASSSNMAAVDFDGDGVPGPGDSTIEIDPTTGDLTITTGFGGMALEPGIYQWHLDPGLVDLSQMTGRDTLQVTMTEGSNRVDRNMVLLGGNDTIIPQVAGGPVGDDIIDTSIIVDNPNPSDGNAMLQCWDENGGPMDVIVFGSPGSMHSFTVPGHSTLDLPLEPGSTLGLGWCEVTSDEPLGVSSRFRTRDKAGNLIGEAGISGVDHLSNRYVAPVDRDPATGRDTALAIVNPSDQSASVTLDCTDAAGGTSQNSLSLGPGSHVAMFSGDLCNVLPSTSTVLKWIRMQSDTDLAVIGLETKKGWQQSSLPVPPRGLGVYSK